MQAKQVGEFIKNGHKNFTHPYREGKCFDSVTLWTINGLISVWAKKICLNLGKKLLNKAKVGGFGARGKKTVICHLKRYKSEN